MSLYRQSLCIHNIEPTSYCTICDGWQRRSFSKPVTNLESNMDAAIIEELNKGFHPYPGESVIPVVAKRIRNRMLELIST